MSRGSKIYKRFGLKFVFAYRLRRAKRKILRKTFVQELLMLYNCFNLQRDFKAFGIYRTLRQQNVLIANPKNVQFILQYYNFILEWLNSKEFKTQYLETNHPYPPLLNPKRLTKESSNPYSNLSYESIPAELAWDLNLPLPPYYQFVYWGSHGTGSSGLTTFLEYCGVNMCSWFGIYGGNGRKNYLWYFRKLQHCNNDSILAYLSIREFAETANKFYALVPCSKALLTARDPIGNLKSFVQFAIPKEGWKARAENPITITLQSEPKEVCKNLVRYWNIDSKNRLYLGEFTSLSCINYFIDTRKYAGAFHDTQLKNVLINLKDSIIIDMSEIVGEKAFDTMVRLSKELGFQPPKEEERERFKTQRVAEYLDFLPITLKIKILDTMCYLYLRDNALNTDYLNLTPFLFNQNSFYDRIIVCAKEADWNLLQQDSKTLQEVKDYLLKFIPRLQEQKEIEDKKKITESQVLDYLKEHKEIRMRFKQVLDEHLAYIKSVRPDIVESWKYYQEFERMCEEMD